MLLLIFFETETETERENSNSKTIFYKGCSLGSVKNLSNNYSLLERERQRQRQRQTDRQRETDRDRDRQTDRQTDRQQLNIRLLAAVQLSQFISMTHFMSTSTYDVTL